MPVLRQQYEFLWETLELSGHLLRKRFGDPMNIRLKADRSLVTDADIASEKLILARIRESFPDDLILSEESGMSSLERRQGQGIWIVDPLDGTTNFSNHYPHFAVSMAYGTIRADMTVEVQVGGVIHPMNGKLFMAHVGSGATCSGKRISVSNQPNFARAFLVTGFYYNKGGTLEMDVRRFAHITDQCQSVRGDGAATLDLCYVAEGIYDGFWEFGLQPWDVAAGALIVQEAGGRVANYPDPALSPAQQAGRVFNPEGAGVLAGSEAIVSRLNHLVASTPSTMSQ